MLQRAAGNAYSWWWASHIRTKQTKWLEQSLQDMEEKVGDTLKIINNEGDSFGQRAEMYYRKRPELVAFVEETFKEYRSLAEKYDKLSKQLQSANRTIATVCPEQVRYHMDEDDDGGPEMPFPSGDGNQAGNIPKVPKFPGKDFRSTSMMISRKGPPKRMASSTRSAVIPCSGLSKTEALQQIDKLQKEILSLQTEKEFVKGVYERAYEKFWEMENKIVEMQKRVYSLQDEFGVGTVIEDDEARALMASTALRSCKETLDKLQKVRANLSDEAQEEYQRLKEAHERFVMLRDEFISKHMNIEEVGDSNKPDPTKPELTSSNDEMDSMEEAKQEQELLREKIKLQFLKNSNCSMTMTELADRIDELVNRVATLETSSTSHTVMVQRLKLETGGLHSNVKNLECDKEKIIEDADQVKTKLKDLEDELKRVKDLNQTVRKGNNSLQSDFTEVSCNLEHLSERLQNVKHEEEEEAVWFKKRSPKKNEEHRDDDSERSKARKEADTLKLMSICEEHNATDMHESGALGTGEEHEQPNLSQMFINGLDDREKILLEEYTSVLRNYKEVRTKLNEVEKKNRETVFELVNEIRGLKSTVASKEKEIQFLHQKTKFSDTNPAGSSSDAATEDKYTPNEGILRARDESDSEAKCLDSPTAAESREEGSSSSGNSKYSDHVRRGSEEKDEVNQAEKPRLLSTSEAKLRADIDELLEENLEFWLRYSTSVHQIQKFQNSVQDLRGDVLKVREKIGKGNPRQISEVRAIYIHFREIQTELTLWLEHNSVLEDELEGRLSSLVNIQDEITNLSSAGNQGGKPDLSDYQAAKFQGEVLNMKQENKKVAKELRSGLDHVTELKIEVDNIITKLEEEFDLNKQSQMKRSTSKPQIPLRSFLFGVKLKKKSAPKASLFSCVNPTVEREYDMLPIPELPR